MIHQVRTEKLPDLTTNQPHVEEKSVKVDKMVEYVKEKKKLPLVMVSDLKQKYDDKSVKSERIEQAVVISINPMDNKDQIQTNLNFKIKDNMKAGHGIVFKEG